MSEARGTNGLPSLRAPALSLGPQETLEFRQEAAGSKSPWKFYAASMSDGTLRALGAIVAASQLAARNIPVSLVGIEEPETALHPVASGALMDALREAATHTQAVVTTHSPELLDEFDSETDCLLSVQARQENTVIGPIDPASRDAIRTHLFTAGDLLRMDQLDVDRNDLDRHEQMRMFETQRRPDEPAASHPSVAVEDETWFVAAAESLGDDLDLAGDQVPGRPEESKSRNAWVMSQYASKGARGQGTARPWISPR